MRKLTSILTVALVAVFAATSNADIVALYNFDDTITGGGSGNIIDADDSGGANWTTGGLLDQSTSLNTYGTDLNGNSDPGGSAIGSATGGKFGQSTAREDDAVTTTYLEATISPDSNVLMDFTGSTVETWVRRISGSTLVAVASNYELSYSLNGGAFTSISTEAGATKGSGSAGTSSQTQASFDLSAIPVLNGALGESITFRLDPTTPYFSPSIVTAHRLTIDDFTVNADLIVSVPEPSTIALLGSLGAIGFIAVRRRRKKA